MAAARRVFRPRATLAVCVVLAAAFVGGAAFLLVSLDDYGFDRVAILVMVGIVVVVTALLGRVRAVADADGLEIRNPVRRRRVAWSQIVAVHLGVHDSWVRLDLDDGTTCALMAIQAADGARARRDAAWLRDRVAEHEGREPT